MANKSVQIVVRLDEATAQRITAARERESTATGYEIGQSEILRRALTLGLDAMERERGAATPKAPRAKR